MLTVTVGGSLPVGAVPGGGVRPDVAVNGPLGAHFLAWEYATAVAGRVIGIDPFSLPGRAAASALPVEDPAFVEGAIEVYGTSAHSVEGALGSLLLAARPHGYVAVMAFLDRFADARAAQVRPLLAELSRRPVTFGWGPRFLHTAGLYHKGGPQLGAFLQITGAVGADLAVPGKPYTFGTLQATQAAGDRQALTSRGRPSFACT
ncbi:hypothetical protein Prum_065280 [Phytohabitans rumicis]|uniref:Uncharacterized protein n=1 Tax=Phytohabitans rumicis TaxID=1076125 RepID=A0A6V8LFN5_9ACTN|nr:hypothetical protein Prum_065280 [Phytohabitans rumicis]